MLIFQINAASHIPAYRQLVAQVKYYVAAGTLKGGDKLPSIRELARELSLNPTTIVRAYGELAHEGVIAMQQGKGVFVAESPARGMTDTRRRDALKPLMRQVAVESRQLGASPEFVARLLADAWRELALGDNDDAE